LTVTGDMTAGYLYGDASNVTGITSNLHQIAEIGNVTSNTLQFTNATTGFVTTGNVSVGGELTVTGNVAVDTDTLFVDTVNNRVGVGTTTPQKTLEVAGPMRITDGLSNVCDLSIGSVVGEYDTTGTKIFASDPQAGATFGDSVSISEDGTKMIVGSKQHKNGSTQYRGAAYVYTYDGSTWGSEVKIVASDPGNDDRFGAKVSMNSDGTKVLVTAYEVDTPGGTSGAVYIYTYDGSTWGSEVKLQSSDIAANDYFGWDASMSGDGTRIIVGTRFEDPGGTTDAASCYIFTYSSGSWDLGTKIVAYDKLAYDWFGTAVAMSKDGTRAIVGASLEGESPDAHGAVYIYTYNGSSWPQTQASVTKLVAADKGAGDKFGSSVAINSDGTKVIVGAYGASGSTGAADAGAAYIFALSGGSWSQEARIEAPQLGYGAYDVFGSSVAMSSDGTRVLVGEYAEDTGGTDAGAAYIFTFSGGSWDSGTKIVAYDNATGDYFGHSVAMNSDGSRAVVGALVEDPNNISGAGSVYIFEAPVLTALVSSTPISAAGTTLSFTGQHVCVPEGPVSPGLVVSANKNRYVSLNGTLTTGVGAIRSSESLPVVSLSNIANDRSVFGVVDRLEQGGTTERRQVLGATVVTAQKELGDTRVIVNSLGEGAIWVADTNGPLVSGDYMTTSNITGYAQKQDDDILHNYTVAKITMDCDFNPDDVPIQVIKKKDTGYNDLDVYGRIQWEDHPLKTTQKAYTIGYLTVDGNRTDEANAVHRTAFVGCTYHCG